VPEIALLSQIAGTANDLERTRLALNDPRATVLRATRVRHDGGGRPVALEEVILPQRHFFGLDGNGYATLDIFELAQRQGLKLGRATERVSTIAATAHIAKHLKIAAGTEVLKLDRVTETVDGVPFEWRVTFARMTN
jgi:DNA-binding GntR family transcriptional regulator